MSLSDLTSDSIFLLSDLLTFKTESLAFRYQYTDCAAYYFFRFLVSSKVYELETISSARICIISIFAYTFYQNIISLSNLL